MCVFVGLSPVLITSSRNANVRRNDAFKWSVTKIMLGRRPSNNKGVDTVLYLHKTSLNQCLNRLCVCVNLVLYSNTDDKHNLKFSSSSFTNRKCIFEDRSKSECTSKVLNHFRSKYLICDVQGE